MGVKMGAQRNGPDARRQCAPIKSHRLRCGTTRRPPIRRLLALRHETGQGFVSTCPLHPSTSINLSAPPEAPPRTTPACRRVVPSSSPHVFDTWSRCGPCLPAHCACRDASTAFALLRFVPTFESRNSLGQCCQEASGPCRLECRKTIRHWSRLVGISLGTTEMRLPRFARPRRDALTSSPLPLQQAFEAPLSTFHFLQWSRIDRRRTDAGAGQPDGCA
ncbi:hypothetical protein K505DRAFT_67830 [Melanomma pulvis-pyrius CBS 109.77]|uniref:Uncharacterized protein n=1 Tax=Melanomma pulvis-pyrius CBS 109.77 TaxID=1314802 RepID=A0A6A6X5A1_9PLEO|nr:hypothetical protein K505DRAFT_67830 [Melanomma pulvis-pyrius CBS 109.77]